MSRIGKLPINIPSDVKVTNEERTIFVKGKLGELNFTVAPELDFIIEAGSVTVKPKSMNKKSRSLWGLTRTIISNMIKGVSVGYSKKLEISGVGFRASMSGEYLSLALGFSHEIKVQIPEGIKIVCEKPTLISITGYDKEKVGQISAVIRSLRGPEPYKGKGVKYEGEKILRKVGKTK